MVVTVATCRKIPDPNEPYLTLETNENMSYFNKVKISSFDQLAAELTAELTNYLMLPVIKVESSKTH